MTYGNVNLGSTPSTSRPRTDTCTATPSTAQATSPQTPSLAGSLKDLFAHDSFVAADCSQDAKGNTTTRVGSDEDLAAQVRGHHG